MATYAIVEAGGKQYRAEKGTFLLVDRMPEDEGAKVALRPVMFRSDDDTVLGADELAKVKVEATITGHERGEKIKVFKYKAKKGYRRHMGHRSELTRLEITDVKMLSRKPAGAAKDEKADDKPKAEKQAAPTRAGLPEDLGKPATTALEEAGLTTLKKVAAKTEAELLELHGVGPKAVETLAEALSAEGLSLNSEEKESD